MLSPLQANNLCVSLGTTDCIKKSDSQEFLLSSGERSNVYVDLRTLVSHPIHLSLVARYLWSTVKSREIDYVVGVPYGGIPLASYISCMFNVPMLLIRKEEKKHGSKQMFIVYGMYGL